MHMIQVPSVWPPVLFGPTLVFAVSKAVMKFTPLPRVLLWIFGVVLSCPALAFPLVLQFGGTFPWLQIRRSKVSLLLLKFLLDLGGISICRAKRGNVEELHFLLNVSMKTVVVSKSLIPNFLHRVWNKFVNPCTS